MEIQSITPVLAMAASLLGVVLIVATGKTPNVREACSLGAAALQCLIVLTLLPSVLAGNTIHYTLISLSHLIPTVSIAFRVDAMGFLLAATASFLWFVTTIYSIGYMRALKEHAQTRYYACFALTMSATIGIAFAANLVTLYLFYEALTLSTYFLVTHQEDKESFSVGRKYVYYHFGTSILFLLPAIIATYAVSGTFAFQPDGVFPAGASATMLVIIYFLFLAGSAKAAIMPFHAWLPAAMVAPVPVSALLHAVAVVNVGVFGIMRVIFDVFGQELMQQLNLSLATAVIASFTIMMATLYAFRLDSLKAILAYSTITHLSEMVLGAVILSPTGVTGGLIHIVNHSVSKITLFFCAGAIYVACRKTNISEMSGVGRQMPWTTAAFIIGALSIIGVPSTAGFITKWFLAVGSMEAEQYWIFFVIIISTLLSAAYYLRILERFFSARPALQEAGHPVSSQHHGEAYLTEIKEPSPFIVAPLLLTALITIVFGLYPTPLLTLVRQVLQ